MRPRTLKVLYNIIYEEFQGGYNNREGKWMFICHTINFLLNTNIITENEYNKIHKHFIKQYPSTTQYKEFYENISFNPYDNHDLNNLNDLIECSWFQPFNRTIRIEFLEAILLKLA